MMESSLTTPYHRIAFPLLAFYDLMRAPRAPRQVMKGRDYSLKFLGIPISGLKFRMVVGSQCKSIRLPIVAN